MHFSQQILALMISVIAIGDAATSVTAAAETRLTHQDELWVLENGQLRVTVDAQAGTLSVPDKVSAHEWRQAPAGASKDEPKLRHVREVADPSPGIAFEADFGSTGGKPNTISVTLTMPADASDLFVEADMRGPALGTGLPRLRRLDLVLGQRRFRRRRLSPIDCAAEGSPGVMKRDRDRRYRW